MVSEIMGIALIKIVFFQFLMMPLFAASFWKNDNQEAYDLLSKQVSELREIGNLPDLNGVIDVNYGEG